MFYDLYQFLILTILRDPETISWIHPSYITECHLWTTLCLHLINHQLLFFSFTLITHRSTLKKKTHTHNKKKHPKCQNLFNIVEPFYLLPLSNYYYFYYYHTTHQQPLQIPIRISIKTSATRKLLSSIHPKVTLTVHCKRTNMDMVNGYKKYQYLCKPEFINQASIA